MIRRNNKFSLNKFKTDFLHRYRWQILTFLGLIIVSSIFFPRGKSLQFTYQKDNIARETVIAPYTFPILKPDKKLQEDIAEALNSEPALFNRSQEVVDIQIQKINNLFLLINDIQVGQNKLALSTNKVFRLRYETAYQEAVSEFNADSVQLSLLKATFTNEYSIDHENTNWKSILWDSDSEKLRYPLDKFKNDIIKICRNRWSEGIYDIPLSDITSDEVLISQGEIPILVKPADYNDLEKAWTKARIEVNNLYSGNNQVLRDIGYDIVVKLMLPNLIYDKETTERRRDVKLNRVPRYQGTVLENERIVEKNTRITDDVLLKLKSLEAAMGKSDGFAGWGQLFLEYIGKFIIIGVVLSFFFTFLLLYRKDTFLNSRLVLLIAILFTSTIALAYLFYVQLDFSEYLIPVVVTAMTLTILFDARIGFMGATTIVLLIGMMIGNNIDFIIVMLFTSSIAMYNVRQLRTRSQVFTTIFSLLGASILVIIAIGIFKNESWDTIKIDLMYLSIVSVLAPIITYGLIGLFEIGFGVTTDLTLLELLDFNNPLLKRLQQQANGTFNHSVVVGNLAEGCSDAIGAHALLCRVGAYYHDIGKLKNPEYFIENQFSGESKHDKVTWTMSAKVIRNHVKEGLRLANEYGLPKVVQDFIATHHGNTRVEYFYRQALAEVKDPSEIDENAFRYPGPKPQTKETGILMICESIEAAVRSIKDPDIVKVEDMIDRITKKKLDDGQLDECPLTLDELRRIKGTVNGNTGMLPILRGIFHIRIEYPEEQPKASRSTLPPS
ncbi:HDIG domain-containing protein [bacterium]|nr:HDIG domain-containing protein [bacterium]